ncbi:hypothetical protein ERJ75_000863100 [Trypanosoma vivax]|nr:hypothetical protein ERJ75_000863100 [Trypanosoma vivax]
MVKDVVALLATVLSNLQNAVKAIPKSSAAVDETAKSIVLRSLSECQGVANEDPRAHCNRLRKRLREIRVKNGLEGDLLNASVSGDDLISLVLEAFLLHSEESNTNMTTLLLVIAFSLLLVISVLALLSVRRHCIRAKSFQSRWWSGQHDAVPGEPVCDDSTEASRDSKEQFTHETFLSFPRFILTR